MKTCLRRWMALCLAICCVVCLSPRAVAAGFSDVPKNYWARREILDMQSRGLLQGSNGNFRPNEPVTTQAFLSILCRINGLDDRNLESGAGWADPAMAYGSYKDWFDEEEITKTSRGKPISRELAAKLLVNACFPGMADRSGRSRVFSDQDQISQDRLPYVRAASSLGLISGYEDGRFDPNGSLTRAAAAAILYRALGLLEAGAPAKGAAVQVPVLMYHDVSYLGYGYSKTPEIFKQQMRELKNAGFHTVSYAQLVDFVDNGAPLPEKPIVISVDDGYRTNYEYIYPILKELDMKIELSVIGGAIQYSSWGLKWDEVREMADSGLVGIQAHTHQMHGDHTAEGGRLGVLKSPKESWADYVDLLSRDTTSILDLVETKTGTRPIAFTYPRGKWNYMAEAIVTDLGCRVTVTTKDGVAKVTQGDPNSLHLMDRIGMDFRNGSVVSVLKQFGYQG